MADLKRRRELAIRAGQKGVESRKRRAQLREQLRDGTVDPLKLVRGEDKKWEKVIAPWRLEQLLPHLPGVGSATVQEIYAVGPFVPTQRFRSLSTERRERLAELCAQGMRIPHNAKSKKS